MSIITSWQTGRLRFRMRRAQHHLNCAAHWIHDEGREGRMDGDALRALRARAVDLVLYIAHANRIDIDDDSLTRFDESAMATPRALDIARGVERLLRAMERRSDQACIHHIACAFFIVLGTPGAPAVYERFVCAEKIKMHLGKAAWQQGLPPC